MKLVTEPLVFGTLFLCSIVANSATLAETNRIDQLVGAEMRNQKIPGLSVAVLQHGQPRLAKGYGLANVELHVPATAETIYQSGSMGKQFTATLVMMLVEQGKLRLDDSISKYFPRAPAAWKDITIRHLLSHTSGISNEIYNRINLRQDYTEDELLDEIAALPLDFAPGRKWNYSNAGYVTLGIFIHKATGKFYGDLLSTRIFAPLGMATARIINEADIITNRASGYRLAKGQLKNQDWVSPVLNTTADGSLYFSVLDIAKWDAGLRTEKLLKNASLEQMWTPVKLANGKTEPYGFGWFVHDVKARRLVEHGGEWQGFTTFIARYLDEDLTVIVLTNPAGADPGKIAHGIADVCRPAP